MQSPPGPSGPASTVGVMRGLRRELQVDDGVAVLDVEAPGCDVADDEGPELAVAEALSDEGGRATRRITTCRPIVRT